MSEHQLPDDCARWPSNPHALLGIESSASSRDVRRAYNRLVKQFRPEKYPDHFRRIHEAYERAKQIAEWQQTVEDEQPEPRAFKLTREISKSTKPSSDDESSSDAEPDQVHAEATNKHGDSSDIDEPITETADVEPPTEADRKKPSQAGESSEEAETAKAPPTGWRTLDEFVVDWDAKLDEAWQLAKSGDYGDAYRELVKVADQRSDSDDVFVRLYWLLRLQPSLDEKKPRQWLTQALVRGAKPLRLVSLLKHEIQSDDLWAISNELLTAIQQMRECYSLSELVNLRWAAALRLRSNSMIREDIKKLRDSTIAKSGDQAWANVLVSALEQFSHHREDHTFGLIYSIQVEMGELAQVSGSREMDYTLERFDEANLFRDAVDDLRQCLNTQGEAFHLRTSVVQLLRTAAVQSRRQTQIELARLANDWMSTPTQALEELDAFQLINQLAFGRFYQFVCETFPNESRYDYRRQTSLEPIMRSFVVNTDWSDNPRRSIVQFCIRECTTTEDLVEYLASNDCPMSEDNVHALSENIHFDLPLRLITAAFFGLWSMSIVFAAETDGN